MLNVYVVTEKVKITPDTDTTYFAAYQKICLFFTWSYLSFSWKINYRIFLVASSSWLDIVILKLSRKSAKKSWNTHNRSQPGAYIRVISPMKL